jgi:hypothetical protein
MSDLMLNVGNYSKLFLNGNGLLSRTYSRAASDEDKIRLRGLGGDPEVIDTPLEIALLSNCAGVVDIRPVEADAILPANNPRAAGLKLGSAVLKELTELKFLDPNNRAAIGRYEGMLHFISGRNGVSGAEIESYYRQGIGALIAAEVDAQFNRVSFRLDWYNASFTRTNGNQYILRYEDVNDIVKELPPASLETLLAEMRNNRTEFKSNAVDTVRSQAALIPAVALGGQSLDDIKVILTNFYTTPNSGTYNAVREVYSLFHVRVMQAIFNTAAGSYLNTIETLNRELARKVARDDEQNQRSITALTREQQQRLVQLRQ